MNIQQTMQKGQFKWEPITEFDLLSERLSEEMDPEMAKIYAAGLIARADKEKEE